MRRLVVLYVMLLGVVAFFTAPLPGAALGFGAFAVGLVILIPRRWR